MKWIKYREGEGQPELLYRHLQTNKKQGITEKEAADMYGIRSFHRRLSDLKERGLQFNKTPEIVPTRYGKAKKTMVYRYTLKETSK